MSVADQINRIKTNIANTYTAAQAKGATMPQTQNSDNLAACVQSITTGGGGGGGGTQFGLTISDVLGTVDGTGAVSRTTISNPLDFSGITSFTNFALAGKFMYSKFSPSQDVEFPALTSIGSAGMYYAFYQCSGITSVSFPALTSISSAGMETAFRNCSGLTSISFPALTRIGQNSMNNAFRDCEKLESISFPELTQVTSPFNSYTFGGCDALTEIHFRADMQTTIEALPNYSTKFGAPNATIYFDL